MASTVLEQQRLIDRWIEPDASRPGPAEVRIRDDGPPVWSLVGYLKAMDWDVPAVAAAFGLPEDAVRAAVAYYQQHQAVIDGRLTENLVP